MIVEERDYKVRAGKLATFVGIYGEHGLPIQLDYLDRFLGYFTTEHGELNHVVAWWAYESLDDRAARRERMIADARWQGYLARTDGLIDTQSSRILKPTAFSPLK